MPIHIRLRLTVLKLLILLGLLTAFNNTAIAETTASANSTSSPTILILKKYPTTVNGKATQLFKIVQPDGTWGYHGVKGQYFDVIVKNQTGQPTAIHWHGLILPNDQDGALRDTVLVLPQSTVKVQFDADHPGNWMLHCHMLYHQESGMMTLLTYDGVKVPDLQ
ncbi:MAG TPA: multicopper oxidase domain-containing protein [Gammaproteobacteria bacterium]|jgi:FtsP/CotA-like multicopper oxidase with cupredoxin domain|nr:multicopper oxidase domain-containing protein [Gammaproteobacteria bacterium]